MVDSDGSSSSASASGPPAPPPATNLPPITRSLFPGDEARTLNLTAMIGADVGGEKRVVAPLDALKNDPDVLERMLTEHRWLDTAKYLDKAFGVGDGTLLRAHPELFVLPRRQHALDLVAEGKEEEAEKYFNDSIFAPTRLVHRTPHLDSLIKGLGDMIRGIKPLQNVPEETVRDIWDYIRVYFPIFNRNFDVVESKKALHTAAAFGEVVGGVDYRCLVCHQLLTFLSDPFNRMVHHLHDLCPAMTPAVRGRLPRRNRPPWMSPSSASSPGDDDDDDSVIALDDD